MAMTVYIETSVVSYYVSRPSRDLIVAAHQQITHEWWNHGLGRFEAFVSDLVVEEVSAGDTDAVARRLEAVDRFEVLETTATAEQLATRYLERIPILESAVRDAFHLAIASASMMDYLVTWNCAHIARAEVRQAVRRENEALGLEPVTICTPEELLGE